VNATRLILKKERYLIIVREAKKSHTSRTARALRETRLKTRARFIADTVKPLQYSSS